MEKDLFPDNTPDIIARTIEEMKMEFPIELERDDMKFEKAKLFFYKKSANILNFKGREARGEYIKSYNDEPYDMHPYVNHAWHKTMSVGDRQKEVELIVNVFFPNGNDEKRVDEVRYLARRLEKYAYCHKAFEKKNDYCYFLLVFRTKFQNMLKKIQTLNVLKPGEIPHMNRLEEMFQFTLPRQNGKIKIEGPSRISDVDMLVDGDDFNRTVKCYDFGTKPLFTHLDPDHIKQRIGINNRKIAVAKYTTRERPEETTMQLRYVEVAPPRRVHLEPMTDDLRDIMIRRFEKHSGQKYPGPAPTMFEDERTKKESEEVVEQLKKLEVKDEEKKENEEEEEEDEEDEEEEDEEEDEDEEEEEQKMEQGEKTEEKK